MPGLSPTFTQKEALVRIEAGMRAPKTTNSPTMPQQRANLCEAVPRLRYFIGQTKKIGNAIRKLCCFPSENQPPLGQNRVCPQKQGTERVFIEKAAGTDKVHLCLVLPSLLCAGSSSVSPFRFPKIVSFSHSVSTL